MAEIQEMITDYLEYRKIKGLSPQTLRHDQFALKIFTQYLLKQNLKINLVTLANLQNYHTYLNEQGKLGVKEIYSRLGVVRQFFHYCHTENKVLHNPAAKLELPKYPKTAPHNVPTIEEVKLLLTVPDLKTLNGLRNRSIMEVAYSAGLRRNEVISLNHRDVDLNARQLRVLGKGNIERVVPIGKSAAYYLNLYIKASRKINPDNPAIFQTRRGTRLNQANLNAFFSSYNKKLGFSFTFHSLRHACALHMLQNKAGIRYIQELLGHSCIRTTQIYTQLLPLDLKKAHERSHPREKELGNFG
jgi:site-specific recombinase XerD